MNHRESEEGVITLPEIEKLEEMEDNQPFLLGEWHVDPVSDRISRGDQSVKLEPKVMDVLVYLSTRPGQVASREELEASVWEGVTVGYEALTSTILKLRKVLGDDPKHPRYIETVSKRGYRLVAEVHPPDEIAEQQTTRASLTKRSDLMLALFVIVTIITSALVWFSLPGELDRGELDIQASVPVAVLPFNNITGDPAQQYYVDGITSDLIAELSRIPQLSVISGESTLLYKDDSLDNIRQKLGVDYVLKGNVRRNATQVRINAQLIETQTGRHLWAEHFDATLKDTFSMQDAITGEIADFFKVQFSAGQESIASRYSSSIEAYDLFLRGLEHYSRRSFDDLDQAASYYRQAIALDPNFARAYANLGLVHFRHAIDGWEINAQGSLDQAKLLAEQALQLNDQLAEIYFVNAIVDLFRRDYENALLELDTALELRPSYADAYALLAWVLQFSGRPEQAIPPLKRAIQLNPKTPVGYLMVQGDREFQVGRYADAIVTLEYALQKNPVNPRTQAVLAAAYAQASRIDDAHWMIDQLLMENPNITSTKLRDTFPYRDDSHLQQLLEGLRKAGIPD